MRHWFAKIVDKTTGKVLEIGAWSETDLYKDLKALNRSGRVNLRKCSVEIYSVAYST